MDVMTQTRPTDGPFKESEGVRGGLKPGSLDSSNLGFNRKLGVSSETGVFHGNLGFHQKLGFSIGNLGIHRKMGFSSET